MCYVCAVILMYGLCFPYYLPATELAIEMDEICAGSGNKEIKRMKMRAS